MKLYREKVGKKRRFLSREDLRNIKHLREISREKSQAIDAMEADGPASAGHPSVH